MPLAEIDYTGQVSVVRLRAQTREATRLCSTVMTEQYPTVICRDESRLIARELHNRARCQAPAMPDGLTVHEPLTRTASTVTDAANDPGAAVDMPVPGRTLVRNRATRHAPA